MPGTRDDEDRPVVLSKKGYDKELRHLRRELVALQEWIR